MREALRPFLAPSASEFATLWREAFFVFDTSTLLDVYRLGREATGDLLQAMEGLQDQVWLPYQVAEEFGRNRQRAQSQNLCDTARRLETLQKSMRSSQNGAERAITGDPEIAAIYKKLKTVEAEVEKALERITEKASKAQVHETDDPNLERLVAIFDGRVGARRTDLEDCKKEARKRIDRKQQPGCGDRRKDGGCGDFIIWKSIMEHAKTEQRPVIMITSDAKDWMLDDKGCKKGPYPELRQEIQQFAGQDIWIYTTRQFLAHAKQNLSVDIADGTLAEARALEAPWSGVPPERVDQLHAVVRRLLHSHSMATVAKEQGSPFMQIVSTWHAKQADQDFLKMLSEGNVGKLEIAALIDRLTIAELALFEDLVPEARRSDLRTLLNSKLKE